MGDLRFDEQAFPNPAGKVASLKNDGIGLITIEESYVSKQGNYGGTNYNGMAAQADSPKTAAPTMSPNSTTGLVSAA